MTVDCAPPERLSYEALTPRLVVEVLSPSKRPVDLIRKLEEYKRLRTLTGILLVEPNALRAILLRRIDEGAWEDESFEGPDAVVPLPEIGATLALREIYESVPFDPEPR